MTYELAIGDRTYSSWSLRGWLLFEKFDIPVRCRTARLYTDELPELLKDFAPARLVPALKTDGIVIHDTMAIAETLAERFPDKNMWPANPEARAVARTLVAEMHSGFSALRSACPMNLEYCWVGFEPSAEVLADCARLEALWAATRDKYAGDGPWLLGDYSIADVFFAPAVTRFVTYELPRSPASQAYFDIHLADMAFRRWRAMGLAENYRQSFYDKHLPTAPWPGPPSVTAKPVSQGPSENATCPYSGKPVTDFLELDGRTFGFCNPFCRDKTAADPEAWDAFRAIYQK